MARRVGNSARMRTPCTVAFFLVAALGFGASAGGAQAGRNAPQPALQPIPFSHRQHCEKSIPCVLCHQTATTGETAGRPSAEICMTCHESVAAESPAIRKVANYAKQHKPIPWVRVYRIQDFVFFRHARHAGAKVACSSCHGQVCESDVLKQEVKLSMMFCIGCHKTEKATMECNACHTLSM